MVVYMLLNPNVGVSFTYQAHIISKCKLHVINMYMIHNVCKTPAADCNVDLFV